MVVATTGGWVRKLRATVPVKMDKISFSTPSLLDMDLGKRWAIDIRSSHVGFGMVNIKSKFYNASSETLIRIEGARCIAYQGNAQQEVSEQRNPMCRVVWRPDVMLMDEGASPGLTKYTDWFVRRFTGERTISEPLLRLAGALDLCAHKNPKAQILLLNADADTIDIFLNFLKAGSPLRRFETFTEATFANQELWGRTVSSTGLNASTENGSIPKESKFDLILSLESLPIGVKDWMAIPATLITTERIKEGAFPAFTNNVITETTKDPVNITMVSERRQTPKRSKCAVVMVCVIVMYNDFEF